MNADNITSYEDLDTNALCDILESFKDASPPKHQPLLLAAIHRLEVLGGHRKERRLHPEGVVRVAAKRTVMCAMCGVSVDLVTLDSPHPEAPTLFQSLLPDFSPWFGFVEGGQIVVVCSEPCAQRLLEEG